MKHTLLFASFAVLAATTSFAACGDSSSPGPGGTGGVPGSGGRPGSGGASGTGGAAATGGASGTGGATGTGGVSGGTGGSAGTGGVTGTGGSAGTGGATGTGGVTGTGGTTGDAGTDTPPASGGLADCFAGLRKLGTKAQLATKTSADGKHAVRIALERIPDSVGTSGTVPWRVVRIGFLTPSGTTCVKDEAALAGAYKGSHHNCSDVLTVTSDGRNFELKTPDTSPGRPNAVLRINELPIATSTTLTQVTCTGDPAGTTQCTSGGPCQ